MKYLHLLHMCLIAVGLLVMCCSAQNGVCTSTETFLEDYEYPEVYSYRCGWWKWRRCHGTRYITKQRPAERDIHYCCGEYTGTYPGCIRKQCPSLQSPGNGNVDVRTGYLDETGTYSCNYGFRLVGSSSVRCKSDYTWSGTAPSCQRIRCPSLRSPSNGKVVVSSYYLNGFGTYSCVNGYRLVGSSSVKCKSDQTWSRTAPSCHRIRCPSLLPSPVNCNVAVSSYYLGGIGTYSCHYGFKLVGSSSVSCKSDQTWSGTAPSCRRIRCPSPRSPSNGNVAVSSYYLDGIGTYSCHYGFKLAGSSSVRCRSDQTWSGMAPSCRRIRCPSLRSPYKGKVAVNSYYLDGIGTYSCLNGYRLVGSSSVRCRSDQTWSGMAPSCRRIRCPSLPSPYKGKVAVSSYYLNGIGTYSCHYGYRLVGSSHGRFCSSDETWTGMAPSCQQIRCPPPTQPSNGTVNVTSNTVDGTALFDCLPTHTLDGSDRRVCMESGEWNGTQPQCVENCIPFIGFNKPFLRIKEGESKTVCLKTCSCYLSSNLTLELKAQSQDDELEMNTDLILPSEITVNAQSNCFEVVATEDDLSEGFEAKLLLLYKPNGERFHICEDDAVLPVSIVDNDELTIGFENFSMSVPEAAGTMEVCVIVSEPNENVPIPDVVVIVQTMHFGEAKQGEDYSSIDRLSLTLSHANRRACFPITINDDSDFEPNEEFSVFVDKDSASFPFLAIPLTLEPDLLTLKIMDDDGISVGFQGYKISVNEGNKDTVCIEATYSSPNSADSFFVVLNTRSLTAEEGSDYEGFNNTRVGPFTPEQPKQCFSLNIMDDAVTEEKEDFTLEISREPNYVMVVQRTTFVTINNVVKKVYTEPVPLCDSPARELAPLLFEHCDDCEYPEKCLNWEEKPGSMVEVPKETCSSKKMFTNHCMMDAISGKDCKPKEEFKSTCVLTTGQKLVFEIGAGNGVSTLPKISRPKSVTSSQPRDSREADGAHCYEAQDALSLNAQQCNASSPHCPYSDNDIQSRDPKAPCTNRSVLFVLDSSHSIGYDLFKEVSVSLSYFAKQLCGDVQFGLLKFSSHAYLEFCFDCYSSDERDKVQERIINTIYLGDSSFTGYATGCVNSFMFGESNSCGDHEGRCVDIIFVTDGQSSDRASSINVCDQVECLHRNPRISDRLNIYALNIGDSAMDEAECITRYSNLRDGSSPIFNFKSIYDMTIELNNVIRLISQDQQKHRKSASKLDYQCIDWFQGKV